MSSITTCCVDSPGDGRVVVKSRGGAERAGLHSSAAPIPPNTSPTHRLNRNMVLTFTLILLSFHGAREKRPDGTGIISCTIWAVADLVVDSPCHIVVRDDP